MAKIDVANWNSTYSETLTYFGSPVKEFPSYADHKESEGDTKAHIHDEFKHILLIKQSFRCFQLLVLVIRWILQRNTNRFC